MLGPQDTTTGPGVAENWSNLSADQLDVLHSSQPALASLWRTWAPAAEGAAPCLLLSSSPFPSIALPLSWVQAEKNPSGLSSYPSLPILATG